MDPHGISAAIYAKRRKLSVLVISKGNGALAKTDKIENYYGFARAISGQELYENGLAQAKNLEIELLEDEVVSVQLEEKYEVETVNSHYQAKSVILATGTNRMVPPIKGIKEFEGKGVSYCAVCDAFFYENKEVAVLGNGNYAIHEMEQLKPVAKEVTILTNGEPIVENRNIGNIKVENKKLENLEEIAKYKK